jgi:type II secretion system protein I
MKSTLPPHRRCRQQRGFTLVEVLVALSIVAIALMAGLQATTALTRNALRQSDIVLAQLCAENELVYARLSRQMPSVGDSQVTCEQAGRHDRAAHAQPELSPDGRAGAGWRQLDPAHLDHHRKVLTRCPP